MTNTDIFLINTLILSCVISYLIGSIPFGLIIGKLGGVGDIRHIGSGNIGATNMMRTGKKWLGILTFLCDFFKGSIAVVCGGFLIFSACFGIADSLHPPPSFLLKQMGFLSILLPLCAVLGHIFPVWLKFKGGKGVATTFGVYLILNPFLFLACAITWLVVFRLWRTSSLAAIISLALSPVFAFVLPFAHSQTTFAALTALLLAILVIARHKPNIQRLLAGTEGNFRKKTP